VVVINTWLSSGPALGCICWQLHNLTICFKIVSSFLDGWKLFKLFAISSVKDCKDVWHYWRETCC
jgi:hypothetical protein